MVNTMHDMDDETRKAILGEALMDELKAIRECVQDVPTIKNDVQALRADTEELKSDMKVVKAAVRDISSNLRSVESTTTKHDRTLRVLKQKIA